MISKFLVWASGHSLDNHSEQHPDHRFQVSRLGFSVVFAACVAAFNWGLAGWVLAGQATFNFKLMYASIAVLPGMLLVFSIDRLFLFLSDTISLNLNLFQKCAVVLFALVRICIILAISLFTSQLTLPFFLGSELDINAMKMQEASESSRRRRLTDENNLDGKLQLAKAAEARHDSIEHELKTVPQNILVLRNKTSECWKRHWNVIKYISVTNEITSKAAQNFAEPRSIATQCIKTNAEGESLWRAYTLEMEAKLKLSSATFLDAQKNLAETQIKIDSLISERATIEKKSLNRMSSFVLEDTIRNNFGAAAKWMIITLMMISCELLPFLLKTFCGRTVYGLRIATEREVYCRTLSGRLDSSERELAIRRANQLTADEVAKNVLESQEVKDAYRSEFKKIFQALAPIEAVEATMRELEANHVDVHAFKQRFPQYSEIISEAWITAIRKSSDVIANSFGSAAPLKV
jgi:hypothetical protein